MGDSGSTAPLKYSKKRTAAKYTLWRNASFVDTLHTHSNLYLRRQDTPQPEDGTDIHAIPATLQNNIRSAICTLYGTERADDLYAAVVESIRKARDARPLPLKFEDYTRPSDWYKDEVIYMFYPEHFGVKADGKPNTFDDLIPMLDYLKNLGVTTLYILPFMDSPLGDAGFDVRDPKQVRADLGGLPAFERFATAAHQTGLKLKADLILNHFSDQHEWFQAALAGDAEKRDYFIVTDKLLIYQKIHDQVKGVVNRYEEQDGSISHRRLMFPDSLESHYREETIQGKKYYFYHTFYPFQPDINWYNPKVLLEVLDIIAFWANLGIDIFRMDAIPFFVKKTGTDAENLHETHQVVKLLSSFLQAIAPKSIILAEACQWPRDILPYFGQEQNYPLRMADEVNKKQTRTDQVQMAYNFPLMPALWASILTNDKSHFWKAFAQTPVLPNSAAWAMFLRVHDELTLEMVDLETRALIYEQLESKGASFRKGLGVSGRLASFLDHNPSRIALIKSLLFSLPGVPIMYYGDEIAIDNNWSFAQDSETKRKALKGNGDGDLDMVGFFDSRDINRGPIAYELFRQASAEGSKTETSGKIFNHIQNLIHLRKTHPVLSRGSVEEITTSVPTAFAYLRRYEAAQALIVNNLDAQMQTVQLTLPDALKTEIGDRMALFNFQTGELHPIAIDGNTMTLPLDAYQAAWLHIV